MMRDPESENALLVVQPRLAFIDANAWK